MDLERFEAERDKLSRLKADLENNLDEVCFVISPLSPSWFQYVQIISLRSSAESKTSALKKLEILVGNACIISANPTSQATDLEELMWLQDGFEYNSEPFAYEVDQNLTLYVVPCRLLPWISASSTRLELLASSRKAGNGEWNVFMFRHSWLICSRRWNLPCIEGACQSDYSLPFNHPRDSLESCSLQEMARKDKVVGGKKPSLCRPSWVLFYGCRCSWTCFLLQDTYHRPALIHPKPHRTELFSRPQFWIPFCAS